jgi:predicted secreted hydrolase
MNKSLPFILIFFTLTASLGWAVWSLSQQREGVDISAQVIDAPTGSTYAELGAFKRAEGSQAIRFPEDFGPHPDYLTEWWYYTGNLQTEDARHFGYQLTFFRRALTPPSERQARESSWSTDQIYLAHFALTDVAENRFYVDERLSRGAIGLAGAQSGPYRVWLEDWQVYETGPGEYQLLAEQDGVSLELELTDKKGPILQGDRGYSQKGPQPGNASYYYSQTHLETEGRVVTGSRIFEVSGLSWKDHEYSTSALSSNQVGWDWFSFQLNDGSEVMVYQIRNTDGEIDPFSRGLIIDPEGNTLQLARNDFSTTPVETWRSPHSGAEYPSGWDIQVPEADLTLEVAPYIKDQELNVTYTYWEGAVQVFGSRDGKPIQGWGYAELTGYAGSFAGEF